MTPSLPTWYSPTWYRLAESYQAYHLASCLFQQLVAVKTSGISEPNILHLRWLISTNAELFSFPLMPFIQSRDLVCQTNQSSTCWCNNKTSGAFYFLQKCIFCLKGEGICTRDCLSQQKLGSSELPTCWSVSWFVDCTHILFLKINILSICHPGVLFWKNLRQNMMLQGGFYLQLTGWVWFSKENFLVTKQHISTELLLLCQTGLSQQGHSSSWWSLNMTMFDWTYRRES